MITLQYYDGAKWIDVSEWASEHLAWISLGGDNFGYRTVDQNGNVLTDNSGMFSLPELHVHTCVTCGANESHKEPHITGQYRCGICGDYWD